MIRIQCRASGEHGKDRNVLIGGLEGPVGLVGGEKGDVYVTEAFAGQVSKVKANGEKTVVAKGLKMPEGIALAGDGKLIVAEVGAPSSSIYFLVAPHGGIRPAQRRRSRLALTLPEREVISRGVTAHQSVRSIAKLLGRSPSTVSREMSRNGGYDRYRATLADEMPGRELVVQNIVNWRTIRGYDRQ